MAQPTTTTTSIDPILFYPRVSGNHGLSRHPPSPFPPSPDYHGTCNLSPTPYFSVRGFFPLSLSLLMFLVSVPRFNSITGGRDTEQINCCRLLNRTVWSSQWYLCYDLSISFFRIACISSLAAVWKILSYRFVLFWVLVMAVVKSFPFFFLRGSFEAVCVILRLKSL